MRHRPPPPPPISLEEDQPSPLTVTLTPTLAQRGDHRVILALEEDDGGYDATWEWLLASGSVIVCVGRSLPLAELTPWVHFVPASPDLSDLVERVQWAVGHPSEAEAIGRAARQLWTRVVAPAHACGVLGRLFETLVPPSEDEGSEHGGPVGVS